VSYEVIDVEREGGTIWVTLNRPQALNALKPPQTFDEFSSVFDEIRRDRSVKALVITGSGDRAFCIGTDLDLLTEAYSTRNFAFFRDYLYSINNFMFALEELPVPTVAMVQGKARAGGFELILACDFVLMADEAKVGDVHTPFGHMPGAGATQRMARKVGIQRALEVILTGRWISAAEAVGMGLALQSAPRADLRRVTAQFVSAFEIGRAHV
jgi:enoyl-CoA hydratase/carnithine racemase